MYIEVVKNRNSPPCILLRESYRENGVVKKRTLTNITNWKPADIEILRQSIAASKKSSGQITGDFSITRSLPHGAVAGILQTMCELKIPQLISRNSLRERQIVLGMIAARILNPGSKLELSRHLSEATATSTLSAELGISDLDINEIYSAMDWLYERQDSIEKTLAKKHLEDGTLIMYDLTSVYMEGSHCELATWGYSRDGKSGKTQIEFGLLCDKDGRPVAVEVFKGNTSDPATVANQVLKVTQRFKLKNVILVGDRGMLTEARIREDVKIIEGLKWISALRAPAIKKLIEQEDVTPELFDLTNLAEITSEDFPDERLIVCQNEQLKKKRQQTRDRLLVLTQAEIDKVTAATQRSKQKLKGKDKIAVRLHKALSKHKMAKHFSYEIFEDHFTVERKEDNIRKEQLLDGIYIVRSNVKKDVLTAAELVGSYKNLAKIERAFRSIKTVDLEVRPIYHYSAERVKSHIFICMLAYYVQWHMRRKLAPMLFDDEDPEQAQQKRTSPVSPAQRSDSAIEKEATKINSQGDPVHSFQSLLADLGTICRNTIQSKSTSSISFPKITEPTPSQAKILKLLNVKL